MFSPWLMSFESVEERANCIPLNAFLVPCDCRCSVALADSACADPEGGQGVRIPPGKFQKYRVP